MAGEAPLKARGSGVSTPDPLPLYPTILLIITQVQVGEAPRQHESHDQTHALMCRI
jgi:hypothetical protein